MHPYFQFGVSFYRYGISDRAAAAVATAALKDFGVINSKGDTAVIDR